MKFIFMFLVLGFAFKSTVGQSVSAAADQLPAFLNETSGPVGTITSTFGCPLTSRYTDQTLEINEDLLWNTNLFERLTHMNRENIPRRIVHAKAAGAKGYFKVTHDVTHITNVKAFSKIGKITPVAVRFSVGLSQEGTADTGRGVFSMATKMYTEEGNWDTAGFNTDVAFIKDPIQFPSSVHAFFRNPRTHLTDNNAVIDYVVQNPEALNFFLQFMGDPGIPATYRNMPSYTVHAFQVENKKQEISFARFVFKPDLGEKYLNSSEGMRLAGSKPDYYIEDLFNAIETGNYPTWTVGFQVIKEKDLHKVPFDIFDLTARWPENMYKIQPIGKLVLNKNPDNYFKDVEQMAFNPNNLPPGMQGCDKTLEARSLIYRDAAIYRLGINYQNIEVNRPLNKVYNYNRNGRAPVLDNFGGTPNYYPNSFNGPVPAISTRTKTKRFIAKQRFGPTNFKQATDYYRGLTRDHKDRVISNIVPLLSTVYEPLRNKVIDLLTFIDVGLGLAIRKGLAELASGQ